MSINDITVTTSHSEEFYDKENWKNTTRSWSDFVADFQDAAPASTPKKKLYVWTPARLSTGRRLNEFVVDKTILALDFDRGQALEEVLDWIRSERLAAIVHSTSSHMIATTELSVLEFLRHHKESADDVPIDLELVDAYMRHLGYVDPQVTGFELDDEGRYFKIHHRPLPKFRVVIPLAEPFVVADHGGLEDAKWRWKQANHSITEAYGLNVDVGCFDLARLFFEAKDDCEFHVFDGRPFDMRRWLDAVPPRPTKAECTKAERNSERRSFTEPEGLPANYEEVLNFISPDVDYHKWFEVGAAICWATQKSEEGFEVLDNWSRGGASYDPHAVDKLWRSLDPNHSNPITWATVVKQAKDNGYTPTQEDKKCDPSKKGATVRDVGKIKLIMENASDIKPRKLEWMWPNRFPRGSLCLIAGEGEVGKTTVLLDMAARISRGAPWPCDEGSAPKGSVIYLSTEDSLDQTVIPRLMAMQADMAKVKIIRGVGFEGERGRVTFNLRDHIGLLEDAIQHIGDVKFIVIDPLNSFMGSENAFKDTVMRSILEPFTDLADRHGVTIVGNTHVGKASHGGAPVNKILNSVSLPNLARAVYMVEKDPEDPERRYFLPAKANLAPPTTKGLAYSIAGKVVATDDDGGEIFGTLVEWKTEAVDVTIQEVLADKNQKSKGSTALQSAIEWVQEYLAEGPVPSVEMDDAGVRAGISKTTLRRAMNELGVINKKNGFIWCRSLPEAPPRSSERRKQMH